MNLTIFQDKKASLKIAKIQQFASELTREQQKFIVGGGDGNPCPPQTCSVGGRCHYC